MNGSWILGSVALIMQTLFIQPHTMWGEFLVTHLYTLRILLGLQHFLWCYWYSPQGLYTGGVRNKFYDSTAWREWGGSHSGKWLGTVSPEFRCGLSLMLPSTMPRLSLALGEMPLNHCQPTDATKPQWHRRLQGRVPSLSHCSLWPLPSVPLK